MSKSSIDFTPGTHPFPDDRNRSILWARYKMEDLESSQPGSEWCILAIKLTLGDSVPQASTETTEVNTMPVCSFAVLDAKGKTVVESLVKPQCVVSNEAIARHGLEYSVVYNAKPYEECRQELVQYLSGKEVIVWDLKEKWGLLNQLDSLHDCKAQNLATVARTWTWHDIAEEYARYVGELVPGCDIEKARAYSPEPYKPLPGLSAVQECKDIKDIIVKMAGTSLVTDPLASGKKGWTAEFYRPTAGPAEKIKKFFDL